MTEVLNETTLCVVIAETLKTAADTDKLSESVTMDSTMGSPREWDSLSFVAVFSAIGQAFGADLDDDDAIHFQATRSIYDFLYQILNE